MSLAFSFLPEKIQILYVDFLSTFDGFADFHPHSVLCDHVTTIS